MQAVVKKVVYSFPYRLGPGQVGREVFHIVLTQYNIEFHMRTIYVRQFDYAENKIQLIQTNAFC